VRCLKINDAEDIREGGQCAAEEHHETFLEERRDQQTVFEYMR
jgi:hypothetical protein